MRDRRSVFIRPLWFLVVVSIAACSTPVVGNDAHTVGDAVIDAPSDVTMCRTDIDCTDSVFCNGAERCMPHAVGTDARGCLAASPATPCSAGQMCSEATMRCVLDCTSTADVDHDGHRSIACGGDDCDDTDANRFPGNLEVCAFDSAVNARVMPEHDEDCDPTTFANGSTHDGDHDGDGYVDHQCANTDRNGTTLRGPDCQDIDSVTSAPPLMITVPAAQIHPTQAEVCNGVDDNCNAMIDEGVTQPFYADCDGDGFGDATDAGMTGCVRTQFTACMGHPPVTNNSDCNDTRNDVHPGALEACDVAMVDENCDGSSNEGCTCIDGSTVPCGSALPGCTMGVETCVHGAMGACSVSATLVSCYTDTDRDGFAPAGAPAMMACSCPGQTTMLAPTNASNTDCNDSVSSVHPSAAEICNGVDDNCNGTIDEGLRVTCYTDNDNDAAPANGATAMQLCADSSRPSAGTCPVNFTNIAPTAATIDCNDAVAVTTTCAAPMHCTPEHVCGCEASLWYNADYLTLATGVVTRGTVSGDLYDSNGSLGVQYIVERSGRTYRHYMASFANVDATYTTGLVSGIDPASFDASSVIVIGTMSGGFWKLGNPSLITFEGSPAMHFTYAPIGAPPAGFACMM